MTRQRWFCCLCGGITERHPDGKGRVLCAGHSAMALDEVPIDPIELLPMTAEVIVTQGAGVGSVAPFQVSPLGSPSAHVARDGTQVRPPSGDFPPSGEVVSSLKGTERC